MSFKISPKAKKLIQDYFKSRHVMVVDSSRPIRLGILKTLNVLGAPASSIMTVGSFDEAIALIEVECPQTIISDYSLGKHCGLELAQIQKTKVEDAERLFLICTSNASETSVAESAEEDIDGYVLKPFTPQVFVEHLVRSVNAKLNPSDYARSIQLGKREFREENYAAAYATFSAALSLSKSPTLAYCYLAQINEAKGKNDEAEAFYSEGLALNKLHYRCLAGLFDLYNRTQRREDAYEIGSRIAKNYPISPQRLGQVMHLAVYTGHFEDIERLYSLFLNLEYRSDDLTRTITAALVICGKDCLTNGEDLVARDFFLKATATSARNSKILSKIIRYYVDEQRGPVAEEFLRMFQAEDQSQIPYIEAHYEITRLMSTPDQAVEEGMKLLRDENISPRIYEILIGACLAAGRKKILEEYVERASLKFPDKREHFTSLAGIQS